MVDLIIHGHFYQPPRENPWTGEVETEAGAAPFHDWNERIHAECYAANAFARLIRADGTVETINNYELLSFNFGPTLLSWLELHHPQTYQRIVEADQVSAAAREGHGNAIAQAYGHAILPLCNERDRLTQVRWGVADFRYRFKREPEALWLPETAANDATLSTLIQAGIRYVILAPNQAGSFRKEKDEHWVPTSEASIDTSRAYRFSDPNGSGRSISVFFYSGPASRAIAFERVLTSSQLLVDLFKQSSVGMPMINVATDGETYGHHFKFGDLCLAHAMSVQAPAAGFSLMNYGQFLDHNPPQFEVSIQEGSDGEGSSWSCVHGVGRWLRDCGCHTGGEAGWNQKWREPLRRALNLLRDEAANGFERLGSEIFRDPWETRDDYIQMILDHGRSRDDFLRRHARIELSPAQATRAIALLEMQRNAILMFTSCGWFFSELSGIETVQILKYAARVIELMSELELPSVRQQFLEILKEAKSNLIERGTGADIFVREAERMSGVVI